MGGKHLYSFNDAIDLTVDVESLVHRRKDEWPNHYLQICY